MARSGQGKTTVYSRPDVLGPASGVVQMGGLLRLRNANLRELQERAVETSCSQQFWPPGFPRRSKIITNVNDL